MKRVIDVEFETRAKKVSTAIERFFSRNSNLDYWKETFEYMAENNISQLNDTILGNGEYNNNWCYALHLDVNEDSVYLCIIERA